MSRVYSWEDDEPYPNATYLFESAVTNATMGKRGQELLKEIEAALLALPSKKLLSYKVCKDGEVCLLGAVAIERSIKAGLTRAEALRDLEDRAVEWGQGADNQAEDHMHVGLRDLLQIKAKCLAWTLVYQNDETMGPDEHRYTKMLAWVQARIIREPAKEVS